MTGMKFTGAVTAICATILVSAGLFAQDSRPAKLSPQQMMGQARMNYMTPGDEHTQLAKRAGQWTFQGKMKNTPDEPITNFSGKSTFKSVMGGRFLFEEVKSEVMGQEFLGFGISGYDNLTHKYTGAWLDNMSTGILSMQGKASADGKVITYKGDSPDFMNGRYKTTRTTEVIADDDNFVITMYNTTPDGQEFKMMEMTYTRRVW